jgi:hypothetical protein
MGHVAPAASAGVFTCRRSSCAQIRSSGVAGVAGPDGLLVVSMSEQLAKASSAIKRQIITLGCVLIAGLLRCAAVSLAFQKPIIQRPCAHYIKPGAAGVVVALTGLRPCARLARTPRPAHFAMRRNHTHSPDPIPEEAYSP